MKRFLLALLLFSLPALAQQSGPFVLTATTSPCATINTANNYATVGIRVSGTFSATLQPGVSIQGQPSTNTSVVPVGSTTSQNTITAAGAYTASVAGASQFQICATGFVSGSVTIWLNVSTGISAKAVVSAGGGLTNFTAGDFSPLFTAGVANPTTTPALTFTASSFAANTVFGNHTNAAAAPSAVTAFPYQVANRVLLAQAAVDGSASAVTLYTVPAGADGIYRISSGIVPRTLSSSAWVVNVDLTFPAGTHIPAAAAANSTLNTGAISGPLVYSIYLHAADVVTCGTVTSSGSNTGGAFDVSWIVERLN